MERETIYVLRNLQTTQSKKDTFMQWRRLLIVKEWEGCKRKDGKSLLLIMSRKDILAGELETEGSLGQPRL